MACTKSGATPVAGTITVSGTGNTMASMLTDIGDNTWVEKVSSSPDVYEIKCRYLTFAVGGELIIGDSGDFSFVEIVRHVFVGTNGYNRLYINVNGMLKMYGASEMILNYNCTSVQYPDYCYIYGNVHLEGDDTYKPLLKGGRRFYFYANFTVESYYNSSEWTLYKCQIGECYANYIYFYIYAGLPKTFLIEDVTIVNDLYTIAQYPFYWVQYIPLDTIPPIKNIKCGSEAVVTYKVMNYGYGTYFKDCVWIATYGTYPITVNGSQRARGEYSPTYDWQLTEAQMESRKIGQWIDAFYENVDLQTTHTYQISAGADAQVIMKNCPNTNNKNNLIQTGANLLCWNSSNVWSRIVISDNYGSMAKNVFLLDLTIQDVDSNPLADCYIRIAQKDDKEFFLCRTGANGKIIALYGLGGVLCANAIKKTTAETLEYWSDNSNSTYHIVTVLKEGYYSETFNVVMDQDRTQTVTLKTLGTGKLYLGTTLITDIRVG